MIGERAARSVMNGVFPAVPAADRKRLKPLYKKFRDRQNDPKKRS
jgi:hypothetical protein